MKTSVHMIPSVALLDRCDLARGNTKPLGNATLRDTFGYEQSNFSHIVVSEFRPRSVGTPRYSYKSTLNRVQLIKTSVRPFKIIDVIIRLVAVNVINLIQTGLLGNERQGDKAMDKLSIRPAPSAKRHAHVTVCGNPLTANSLSNLSSRGKPCGSYTHKFSLNCADSAQVGNLMAFLKAADGKPDLIHEGCRP